MAQEEQSEEGTKEERLKVALWYNVGQMVDSISLDQNLNTTPQFIGGLNEMLWSHVETISRDLESFAKHAGRTTIRSEDVLLLARRNDSLYNILKKTSDQLDEGVRDT